MSLPRATPESQGIPSAAVLAFLDHAEAHLDALHSLMLVRHGSVVAEGWWEPYRPADPHMLFSLSKSFTSTAAGFAIAEGRLSADDPVVSFFPGDLPSEVSANLAAMRVRHLLSMSTGHAEDTLGPVVRSTDGDWVRAFLACPVEHEPGTHFLYNSGATYMVSAIVQSLTGQTVLDYLTPRLLDPLGITGAVWECCPRGINTGGWGLNLKTDDIARFGQLYLRDGVWEGRRILPAGWVAEATRQHIANGDDPNSDWAQGYGYQFWRSRCHAYRGDGAFGQFCVVLPEADAVVAITSGIGDMQGVLNAVWEHLLPAMGPAPLPADPAAGQLRERLAGLRLRGPAGRPSSPVAARVTGRTYDLEPNERQWEALGFDFAAGELTLRENGHERRLAVGTGGEWRRTAGTPAPSTFGGQAEPAVAASGAWPTEDTFTAKLCYVNTPFVATATCRFEGDTVSVNHRLNVSFGPTEVESIVGRGASAPAGNDPALAR